ncbi:MAG: hypothetical protein WAM28_08865 [Chlamydiales bacterium]
MKAFFKYVFIQNWPRKLVALISAVLVWFLVNQTISTTRTISDVPVKVINLPEDKTVVGLLSSGLLNKRITVTIRGKKSAIKALQPNDLAIVINADGHKESWIATIDKRNLVSLNQEIDLKRQITQVSASNLFLRLSKLVTEEIPVIITKPIGDPPKGYQYLNVWPKYLMQRVTGPEEQVRALKERKLELTFNLSQISDDELDMLYNQQGKRDEITFKIPNSWKEIAIPFQEKTCISLNDPRAKLLRIDFLKQELISLGIELPITIFFPVKYSGSINPQVFSLATNDIVHKKGGLKRLTIPLFVRDVSRLFLDVVRDNLLLIIEAAPKHIQKQLHWTVEFIDEKVLEDAFVKATLEQDTEKYDEFSFAKYRESEIRSHFRNYLRNLALFTQDGEFLRLKVYLNANSIIIEQRKS